MPGPDRLHPFRLGEWTVRPSRNVLERDDRTVEVEPKAMELLRVLAERPGESFTRRELLDRVWPGVVVGDEALTRAVYVLRKALGDESRDPTYVETIAKIGYRLLPPVEPLEPAGSAPRPNGSPSGERGVRRALLGVGSIVVTGVVAWALLVYGAAPGDSVVVPFRVTSDPGIEAGAAPSPDGDRIAYSWSQGGAPPDLFVRAIDATRPLQLTDDPRSDVAAAWSPDGESIAFLRTGAETNECQILLIPALGGPEREIASCEAPPTHEILQHLDWSPDGRWILWSEGSPQPGKAQLHALDVSTGDVRPLTSRGDRPLTGLRARFSPDGEALAFLAYTTSGAVIRVVSWRDGRPSGPIRTVASNVNNVHGLTWSPDGRVIHFSSDRDGISRLFRVPAQGGRIERTNVGSEALRPVVVPSRDILVYEEWMYDTDLYSIRVDAPSTAFPGDPIVNSTQWDTHPSVSPDGRRLAFVSSRTGWMEVYLTDSRAGGEDVPVTELKAQGITQPRWSPDGRRIVFGAQLGPHRTGRGGTDVYVIDEPGSTPRLLTSWPGHEAYPTWSKDGKWILFGSERDGPWQIWRVPVGGGEPRRVTREGGFAARAESDRSVLFTRREQDGLWRRPIDGSGRATLVTPDFPANRRWQVRGDVVYRLDRSLAPRIRILATDLTTGTTSVHYELPERSSFAGWFDLSADASRIFFAHVSTVGSDLQAIPIPGRSRGVEELVAGLR